MKNMCYSISKFTTISETFSPLLEELRVQKSLHSRVIIYCRQLADCCDLYKFFKHGLGVNFTDPIDAPDLSQFRLVDMFTSCTDEQVKQQIVKSFGTLSPLRVVCATSAFGMGIDCPDVRHIIHFGAPEDKDTYNQETCRGGRDGHLAQATLLVVKRYNRFCEESMLQYQDNTSSCRRDFQFRETDHYEHLDMGTKCLCCDVCCML